MKKAFCILFVFMGLLGLNAATIDTTGASAGFSAFKTAKKLKVDGTLIISLSNLVRKMTRLLRH